MAQNRCVTCSKRGLSVEYLLANPLLLGLILFIPFLIWINVRTRQKLTEQQEAHRRSIEEGLVPGAWVKTAAGFYGRYVDSEGDVIILDTPDGTETYWARASVVSVGESPFTDVEDEEDEALSSTETIDTHVDVDSEDTSRN